MIVRAEQPSEAEPIRKPTYRLSGTSLRRAKRLLKAENFRKRKSVVTDPSSTEQIKPIKPIEPPEQWTKCRLRRNVRVPKRISAVAEDNTPMRSSKRKAYRRRTVIPLSLRLERQRIAEAKRLANETEEQKFARLGSERQRRARRRAQIRLESLRLPQQREFVNFKVEMIDEDQKADIGEYFKIGNSFPNKDGEESSTRKLTIEIGDFPPKILLPEQFSIESTTENSVTTPDTQIEKETKFDVLRNLLQHSICRKDQPQDNVRLQRFDNLCTSRSSNYILSAVAWHKLNDLTGGGRLIE